MSYASPITSSSSKDWKYDVFLSFRGEDTRRTFVSHLYDALEQRGIHTLKDDERLETGKSISEELMKAIEESRLAIVIFSKKYASSRWCLEELAHIIKCRNEWDQIVIPIFYDVSPSDVRHQNPSFAKSFSKHKKSCKDDVTKFQRWRDALAEAGKIKGHDLKSYKDEADCIKKLVDYIFPKSLQVISPFLKGLVGMKSQIEKVISLLDMESNDVRFIGIWGMGGSGKTEIASYLFQRYRHRFEADCFLGDVGALYQKNGLTWLEQVLIYKLLGEKMTLTSEHEGVIVIKNMLRRKKALLILNDVNQREQLEFFVGGPEWFGRGSRIILTARDKHLLISHVGDNLYEVQLLPENESLELFHRHAFRENSPKKEFMELSRQVVKYAGGLPLALKILGSSFYKRDKEQWRDIIVRLKKIPYNDILGKLRVSFDGLDKEEKAIFLDIACLHKYDSKDYVKLVLKSRGIQVIGIDYLVEKSLISISGYSFEMHNLIREMGENVLREEYANSRIWLPEEVRDLFAGKLKTEKVESLWIQEGCDFKDAHINHNKIFKKMQSLQVLRIDEGYLCLDCAITYLPSSLRFISWWRYPSSSLAERLEPSNLVVLSLTHSLLVELWPVSKKLSNLKYLDLSYSLELKTTPNFGDIPNLETLNLWGCENLEEVHPSLGHCRMLTSLSFRGCKKLKKLPKFVTMGSLERLNLLECTSFKKFPKICGDMRRLNTLFLESPWIRSLPSFSGLIHLYLSDCEVLESIPDTIQNIKKLEISGCSELAMLPNSLFESEQLEELDIRYCSRLVELPISLGVQKKLVWLNLSDCENLRKLPNSIQLHECLEKLKICNCPNLDALPEIKGDMHRLSALILGNTGIGELSSSIGNLTSLTYLNMEGCENVVSLPNSVCNLKNLQRLVLRGCKKLEKLPENIGDLQELEELDASETAISQPIPHSITKLGNLMTLNFSHEQVQSSSSFVLHQVSGLSCLTELDLRNCNILGGLPEDLGSLHSLEYMNVRGNNISCLPKSINQLLCLRHLDVQFCQNLNELPGELPPGLRMLSADYHLASKSMKHLLIECVNLDLISISWYDHEKNKCPPVSTNQVNLLKFLQHFLSTCIQCDFHQRTHFCISFARGRFPEWSYQFVNQEKMSINLDPSWYTDKFIGFLICCHFSPCDLKHHGMMTARLVCGYDQKFRLHDLSCGISVSELEDDHSPSVMLFTYIPFQTLWSLNRGRKNPNDYRHFEAYIWPVVAPDWEIRLVHENNLRILS